MVTRERMHSQPNLPSVLSARKCGVIGNRVSHGSGVWFITRPSGNQVIAMHTDVAVPRNVLLGTAQSYAEVFEQLVTR